MVNVATPKVVELYQSSIGRGIRRLQKRLAKKAIREPEHKFEILSRSAWSAIFKLMERNMNISFESLVG
jgi:hypothetical protein